MPRFLSEAELSVQIPGYYSKLSDVTLHTNYKQNSACHNVENLLSLLRHLTAEQHVTC